MGDAVVSIRALHIPNNRLEDLKYISAIYGIYLKEETSMSGKFVWYELMTTDTAGAKAASAAPAVALLVEGAIVTAVMEQSSQPADVARDAALALISKVSRKRT